MDWDNVYDILYDGTRAEIETVRCPDCGHEIRFCYSEYDRGNTFTVWCDGCHIMQKGSNGPIPNCVVLYGNEHTIS